MSSLLQHNDAAWAILTEAVVGEEETFVVWWCDEAKGAGLAIPAQPDLLGVAGGNGPGNGEQGGSLDVSLWPGGREADDRRHTREWAFFVVFFFSPSFPQELMAVLVHRR